MDAMKSTSYLLSKLGIIAAIFLMGVTGTQAKEWIKCVDKNGKITISDTSCPNTEKTEKDAGQTTSRTSSSKNGDTKQGQKPRGGYGGYIDRARNMDANTGRSTGNH